VRSAFCEPGQQHVLVYCRWKAERQGDAFRRLRRLTGLHVLVVDDNATNRMILTNGVRIVACNGCPDGARADTLERPWPRSFLPGIAGYANARNGRGAGCPCDQTDPIEKVEIIILTSMDTVERPVVDRYGLFRHVCYQAASSRHRGWRWGENGFTNPATAADLIPSQPAQQASWNAHIGG
jgi:hypothetical protein